MRYTTVIDISEIPDIYKNHNSRLLYLHMALKATYHDKNRDWLHISIRRLAADTGLSVAAVRNALKLLIKFNMLKTGKPGWYLVRKWLPEQKITARTKSIQDARQKAIAEERELHQEKLNKQIEDSRQTAVSYEEYLKRKAL